METRKVQVTGGSTYTVSLPKTWATENEIASGATVEIYSRDDTLIITPQRESAHQNGTLDIGALGGEQLTQAVLTMYVSGFDVIRLEANRVTTEQRRSIRSAIQGLIGVEIVDEQAEFVVIQDLLDSSELSIVNAVTRMRLIATSMLEDAVTALVDNDADMAQDVIERDDDVDRLSSSSSRGSSGRRFDRHARRRNSVFRGRTVSISIRVRDSSNASPITLSRSVGSRSISMIFQRRWPLPCVSFMRMQRQRWINRWTRSSPRMAMRRTNSAPTCSNPFARSTNTPAVSTTCSANSIPPRPSRSD